MKYKDSDGNECTLLQLVRREPEWAANNIRRLENNLIEANMIINAVGMALDGEEVSDFELSYPVVRKAQDFEQMLYGNPSKEM